MNKFATRKRNIFNKLENKPFELSRSKLELFIQCPRCFYLDRRLGVSPPKFPPFNLNITVDLLFKKEFDLYRQKKEQHPIMIGTDFIPMEHECLDEWRDPFTGIRYFDPKSNFVVYGGVDDVWINKKNEVAIVDYKATSKLEEPSLDQAWKITYKRQVEIYQWLFDKNGFKVSPKTFFVYANGKRTEKTFDAKMLFDIKLIEYIGNFSWVDALLLKIREVLMNDNIPACGKYCDLCKYRDAAGNSFKHHILN